MWAEVPGFILSIYTHTIPWVFLNAHLKNQLFCRSGLIIVPGELPHGFARAEGRDLNPWEERGALPPCNPWEVAPEQGRTKFLVSVLTVAGTDLNPQESASLGGASIGLGLPLGSTGSATNPSEVHLGPAVSPYWTVSSQRAGLGPPTVRTRCLQSRPSGPLLAPPPSHPTPPLASQD